MKEEIKTFVKSWKSIRGRTLEFLNKIPEDKWTWKPHPLLGTFGMQVRHMCKSQEAYINGMKKGTINFSDKKFNSSVETNKKKAMAWMNKLDKDLSLFLRKADPNKKIIFLDGVEGKTEVELKTALDYLMDHEFYHQGIFTCYGRLAGLGKFLFM